MTPLPATVQVPLTGREYQRVSKDRSGREASPDEQHAENVPCATSFGITLAEPYRDVNRSASRYATRSREEFDRLIADLESGDFGADVLVLWESSRGSRKVLEWVLLLDLLEVKGKLVLVTTHGRLYDPRNPRDRRSLLEDAVDSEYESAKTHERTRRTRESGAKLGLPAGRMLYGYKAVYDEKTGRALGRVPVPEHAAVVRELFDRVLAGHSLRSITKDFERRGIVNRSGRPFGAAHLRCMLEHRSYIGDRVWVQGRKSGRDKTKPEQITKGTWEPIVDRATWAAVQRVLADPLRVKTRPGRGKHLLSMIGRCGNCNGLLGVIARNGSGRYRCNSTGCVMISEADLDQLVEEKIIDFMSNSAMVYAHLGTNGNDDAAEVSHAEETVESIRGELDQLGDQVGAGAVSPELAARAEPGIRKRLADAERKLHELRVPTRLAGLIAPGPDVAARWAAAPMSTRREVAKLLLVPEVMGVVQLLPTALRGIAVPALDRVNWLKVDNRG